MRSSHLRGTVILPLPHLSFLIIRGQPTLAALQSFPPPKREVSLVTHFILSYLRLNYPLMVINHKAHILGLILVQLVLGPYPVQSLWTRARVYKLTDYLHRQAQQQGHPPILGCHLSGVKTPGH